MTGTRTTEPQKARHRSAWRNPKRASIVHRAVRVTTAASAGFYPFVYGVDRPATALYALFGPVALGILSPIPGSGRQRAAVMLRALPVGLVLVALGTVLAVSTWAAVFGMLVVGFVLSFAAVAGPRPAGAAPGLQLFYILACFPPYDPDALGSRLAGLTLGVLLLVACERFLLPEPPTVSYRESLADAVAIAGRAAAAAVTAQPLRRAPLRRTGCGRPADSCGFPNFRPPNGPPVPGVWTGPWHRRVPPPVDCWTNWRTWATPQRPAAPPTPPPRPAGARAPNRAPTRTLRRPISSAASRHSAPPPPQPCAPAGRLHSPGPRPWNRRYGTSRRCVSRRRPDRRRPCPRAAAATPGLGPGHCRVGEGSRGRRTGRPGRQAHAADPAARILLVRRRAYPSCGGGASPAI